MRAGGKGAGYGFKGGISGLSVGREEEKGKSEEM